MSKVKNIKSFPVFILVCLSFLTAYTYAQDTHMRDTGPFVVVLGTVQDAGSPHINCLKDCCAELHEKPDPSRKVVSLGIVDPATKQTWLIEATPDMPDQLRMLRTYAPFMNSDVPDGVFITHAHIGHYTGLMYFGREAMGAKEVAVYAMPRMRTYLENNGPWDQLVKLKNIDLFELNDNQKVHLSPNVSITPVMVPHRDEYSETVGYRIEGPSKSLLFIPDIDKWQKWDEDIVKVVGSVDHAFIDATFYDGNEIGHRNISEIPHPFVIESMELFDPQPLDTRNKIRFIHLNHSNPLLDRDSREFEDVHKKGYHVAIPGDICYL